MRTLTLAAMLCVAAGGFAGRPSAGVSAGGPTAAMAWLERYAGGDFDGVVSEMASIKDFEPLYKELKTKAPTWIDAGGPADRDRRRLAAATFAMEAARIGAATDWKEVRMFMRLENIFWRPPSLLLEWGCQLMRDTPQPTIDEHDWQMAALSVVGRAQDYEFLIGSPWEARANKRDEILHLEHAVARFPKDRRLLLAQGIAAELRLYPNARRTGLKEATQIFTNLKDDAEVGAEAKMRLGAIAVRGGRAAEALTYLTAAMADHDDPYVLYLAHLFAGQAYERQKDPARAETEYRSALEIAPRVQSATSGLALLLAAKGARSEAASLIADSVRAPRPIDPWKVYGYGEDRFWPERIAVLRQEIAR